MNWKMISVGSLSIFAIVLQMIDAAANRRLSLDAGEKAVTMHSAETQSALDDAQKKIDLVNNLNKREAKELNDRTNSWKKLNNYESRKRDIHRSSMAELEEFKDSIDYYGKKQNIVDAADDELLAFKESIDYDYEIKAKETIISDAKNRYKKQCKLYDIAANDENMSDDVSTLKNKAKEAMDDTVKTTKAEIQELKNKVDSELNKINRKKQSELRELELELQSTKTRLQKQEEEAIKAVDEEYKAAKDAIRSEIDAKRTEEELTALSEYEQSKDRLNDQSSTDASVALDIYNNTPRHEKFAGYLRSIKCPRWFAALCGTLPLIPAGFLIFSYGKFVVKTVAAM